MKRFLLKLLGNSNTWFSLFIAWIAVGVFPLVCYENDSMHVIAGCEQMYNEGWQLPPRYSYEYRMQPLVTITIVALRYVIPCLSCGEIYCLFSALSALIFLFGIIKFVEQLIPKENKIITLLSLLLIPETYAIAMYPNSAIPSAAIFIWSLVLMKKELYLYSIALLCVAPLYRVDVVIVYPSILPLLYLRHSFKKSFIISSLAAIIIVSVGLSGFNLLEADVLSTFRGYENWNEKVNPIIVVTAILGFYSITYLILMPLGILLIYNSKNFKILALCLLPITLNHYIYRNMGCASKHYLYILPFVVIIGVYALNHLRTYLYHNRVMQYVVAMYLMCLMFVSLKLEPTNRPWRQIPEARAHRTPFLQLATANLGKYIIQAGIGAGQDVPTLDEEMILSGHAFYPWYIRGIKYRVLLLEKNVDSELSKHRCSVLLTLGWGDVIQHANTLLKRGYSLTEPKSEDYKFIMQKKDSVVYIATFDMYNNDNNQQLEDNLHDYIVKYSSQSVGKVFISSSTDYCQYHLENKSQYGDVVKINNDLFYSQ